MAGHCPPSPGVGGAHTRGIPVVAVTRRETQAGTVIARELVGAEAESASGSIITGAGAHVMCDCTVPMIGHRVMREGVKGTRVKKECGMTGPGTNDHGTRGRGMTAHGTTDHGTIAHGMTVHMTAHGMTVHEMTAQGTNAHVKTVRATTSCAVTVHVMIGYGLRNHASQTDTKVEVTDIEAAPSIAGTGKGLEKAPRTTTGVHRGRNVPTHPSLGTNTDEWSLHFQKPFLKTPREKGGGGKTQASSSNLLVMLLPHHQISVCSQML